MDTQRRCVCVFLRRLVLYDEDRQYLKQLKEEFRNVLEMLQVSRRELLHHILNAPNECSSRRSSGFPRMSVHYRSTSPGATKNSIICCIESSDTSSRRQKM